MKKILLVITFLALIFLTSCSQEEIKTQKYYKTAIVQSWSISGNESAIWYTKSFNSITLSTKTPWRITNINKKVWDKVEAWELLASLDSSEAKSNYSSTTQIINSLNDLKTATSLSFDSQIKSMEEQIKQAQNWVEMAKIWLEWTNSWLLDTKNTTSSQLITIDAQIESAKNSLETAQVNLENTKDVLDEKEKNIYENSLNAISNANILWNNLIDFLDNLLWVTDENEHKNDDFEMYLWAKDKWSVEKAEIELRSIIADFKELKNLPSETHEEIKTKLEKYNTFFSSDIRNILKNAYNIMENSIAWVNLSENTISSYKSQINSLQSQNEQVILTVSWNYFLWLKWSIDSINNFSKEKKSSIDMLEKQITSAQKQIETLKATRLQYDAMWSWQITDISTRNELAKKEYENSQISLNQAKAWLESLKKQKEASLKQIDAQIQEVKSWQNTSWVMIENWKIYATVSWVVVNKLAEIWEVVWAWIPILEIASENSIKIEVQIWNDIIQKVNMWDKVSVEIEWQDEQFIWTISNIFPTLDEVTKKWKIEVKLENKDNKIKIWSYSKVYFNTWEEENKWIIIPNNAIVSEMLIPWVYVVKEEKNKSWKVKKIASFKNIKILKQSDNFSMIEWLSVWDEIITEGKENVFDGEVLE